MEPALKITRETLAALSLIFLASCATTAQPVPGDPRQIWCDHIEPRRDATAETPRAELDRINAHNAKGAAWCGWRP